MRIDEIEFQPKINFKYTEKDAKAIIRFGTRLESVPTTLFPSEERRNIS